MPKAQSAKTKTKRGSDKHRTTPSVASETFHSKARREGLLPSIETKMGNGLGRDTFESHAALLGDPRMSQRMYAQQRTAIVQRLQRDYGNRYVQRLVDHIQKKRTEGVQTRLRVGPAGDRYEREADAVARKVVRGIGTSESREEKIQRVQDENLAYAHSLIQRRNEAELARRQSSKERPQVGVEVGELTPDDLKSLQRQPEPEEDELQLMPLQRQPEPEEEELLLKPLQRQPEPDEEELQLKPLQRQPELDEEELLLKPLAQRQDAEEEEALQMKAADPPIGHEGGDVEPATESAILRAKGSGAQLPENLRTQMESAFGADFSGVSVHTDAQADELNRSMNARAFTMGQDIFYRKGEYNPGTSAGKEIIAHELTHVVQQTGGARPGRSEDSEHERLDSTAEALNVVQQTGGETERITPHPSSNKQNPAYVGGAQRVVVSSEALEKLSSGAGSKKGKSLPLTPDEQKRQAEITEEKKRQAKSAVLDETKKLTIANWITDVVKYIKSRFSSIKDSLESFLTLKAGGKNNYGQQYGWFKDIAKFLGDILKFAGRFAGAISGFAKVWSSVFDGIKAFMAVLPLMKLRWNQLKEGRDTEFSRAVKYGAKKVGRSLVLRGLNIFASIMQATTRTVSAIALLIPGGHWVAMGAEAVDILVELAKRGLSIGAKLKGLGKWAKGTRGVNRAENAGIIVDTARGKIGSDAKEHREAAKLIADLKPEGLLGLITATPEDVKNALDGASEDLIKNLKKGMANKLKST